MKVPLILCLASFVFKVSAQDNKYANLIKPAPVFNAVRIYTMPARVVYFKKTTVIGTVFLETPPNTESAFHKIQQLKDSLGYTTIFTFNNSKHLVYKDLNLIMRFDNPVISVDFSGIKAYNINYRYNGIKTNYQFKARKIESQASEVITIKSKEPIITEIYGLDFIFNQ